MFSFKKSDSVIWRNRRPAKVVSVEKLYTIVEFLDVDDSDYGFYHAVDAADLRPHLEWVRTNFPVDNKHGPVFYNKELNVFAVGSYKNRVYYKQVNGEWLPYHFISEGY